MMMRPGDSGEHDFGCAPDDVFASIDRQRARRQERRSRPIRVRRGVQSTHSGGSRFAADHPIAFSAILALIFSCLFIWVQSIAFGGTAADAAKQAIDANDGLHHRIAFLEKERDDAIEEASKLRRRVEAFEEDMRIQIQFEEEILDITKIALQNRDRFDAMINVYEMLRRAENDPAFAGRHEEAIIAHVDGLIALLREDQ